MSISKTLIISFFLVVLTTLIHNIATRYILFYIKKKLNSRKKYWWPPSYWVSVIVIVLILISLLEASLWALAYINTGTFSTFEESIYFSLVSFTTLGFGENTLNEDFRLMAAIEAANGIILFGWSTAIVIAVVQRIFFKTNNVKNE